MEEKKTRKHSLRQPSQEMRDALLGMRRDPVSVDTMSEAGVRSLLKRVQDDVRAAVAQESSSDGFDMVLESLRDAGLDVSAEDAPEDEDAPPPFGEP